MEIYQLRSFVAVAEEGHLTRASERLHTSQSAVSAQLKALEQELGVLLFDRTSKGMRLTAAGERLLGKAENVLFAAADVKATARSLTHEISGVVRIGLHSDAVFLRVPDISMALSGAYPNLHVRFLQTNSWQISEELLKEEMDVSFAYGDWSGDGITSVFLARIPLFIAGPGAWRDKVEGVSIHELSKLPWLWASCECPFFTEAEELLKRHNLNPKRLGCADAEDVFTELVIAERGISLLREDVALPLEKQGRIALWRGERIHVTLTLSFKESRKDEPMIRALLDTVSEVWSNGESTKDESAPGD